MAKTLADAVERYRDLARLRDGTEYEGERSNAAAALAKLCAAHPELEARIADDDAAIARGFHDAEDERNEKAAQTAARARASAAQSLRDRHVQEEERERQNEEAMRRMRGEKLVRDANWGGGCGPVPLSNPRGVPPVAAAGYTSPTIGGWKSPTRR